MPLALAAVAVAGCAGRAGAPESPGAATADTASGAAIASTAQEPGIDLPAGPGRELLLSRCLGCHDLGGLELFDDYYTREDWHGLLETMVAHGAEFDADELELVADYLGLHYSRRP